MSKYKIFAAFLFAIVCCSVLSCKKKNNDNPFGSAKIDAINYAYEGTGQNYTFFYDANDNIDSAGYTGTGSSVGNNGYYTIAYYGSSFTITDALHSSYKVYANTLGQIIKVLQADTLIMAYKNNVLDELDVKHASNVYPFYTLTSTYYTWANGDLTYKGPAGTTTGTSYSYYYDMSRNGQPGDALRVDDFITYGRSYIKTTHLPMGMISGHDTVESYSYQYDALGRISRLAKAYSARHDTAVYNYLYY